MPAKAKQRTVTERANDSALAHPITWGALKALAVFLVTVGVPICAIVAAVFGWLDGRYEKKTEADAKFNEVVGRLTTEVGAIRVDLAALKQKAGRDVAWLIVGQVRQETLATRNRVNDCRAKESDHKLSSGERPSCMQYEDELKELQIKLREAQKTASDASK